MNKNDYRPYFEAVKQILDGIPVNDLDDIRNQCNEVFFSKVSEEGKSHAKNKNYYPEASVISFTADAENRILMGEDLQEVYEGFNGLQPENIRRRCRLILEDYVNSYL